MRTKFYRFFSFAFASEKLFSRIKALAKRSNGLSIFQLLAGQQLVKYCHGLIETFYNFFGPQNFKTFFFIFVRERNFYSVYRTSRKDFSDSRKIFTRLRQCSENGREKFSPTLLSLLGRLRRTENALRGTTRTAAHHVLLSCARIVHQKHVSFEGFSCWMPLTCNCFVYVRWLECR